MVFLNKLNCMAKAVLPVVISAASLFAVFGEAMAEPIEIQNQIESETLKRVLETGVVKVGVREGALPFSDMKNDVAVGFSVDLCRQIFKGIEKVTGKNITFKFIPVNSKGRFEALKNNDIDIECGSTTHSVPRESTASFSRSFFITGISFSDQSGESTDFYSISGRVVVVLEKSTAAAIVVRQASLAKSSNREFSVLQVKTNDDGIKEVVKNKNAIFMQDEILMAGSIEKLPVNIKKPKITKSLYSIEPYALMMRKGDDNFVKAIDSQLIPILRSGEAEMIMRKWMPKSSFNINNLTKDNFMRPSNTPSPNY